MEKIDSGVITSGLLLSFSLSFSLFSVVGLWQNSFIVIMEFGKLGIIYFGSLDNLDLSNSDVLDGVDGVDFSSDLLLNNFGGEEIENLSGVGLSDFLGNDFVHSASDFFLLGAQSIVGLLLLVGGFPSEGNRENSDNIAISWSAVLNTLNKSFTFLDKSTKLISGHINSVEAAEGISSSGLIDDETDFSPGEIVLIRSKISLAGSHNTSTNTIFNFA